MKTQYEKLMEMNWEELFSRGLVKITYEPRQVKGSWAVWASYRLPHFPQWNVRDEEYFSPESMRDMEGDNAVCDVVFDCVNAFRRHLQSFYNTMEDK